MNNRHCADRDRGGLRSARITARSMGAAQEDAGVRAAKVSVSDGCRSQFSPGLIRRIAARLRSIVVCKLPMFDEMHDLAMGGAMIRQHAV